MCMSAPPPRIVHDDSMRCMLFAPGLGFVLNNSPRATMSPLHCAAVDFHCRSRSVFCVVLRFFPEMSTQIF